MTEEEKESEKGRGMIVWIGGRKTKREREGREGEGSL
jgi:hypothetical protein